MKYPQKSFTYEGKKYKAKPTQTQNFASSCLGCSFYKSLVSCYHIEKTAACLPENRDDYNYAIWVEVNKGGLTK